MKSSEIIELICTYVEEGTALPFKLYADVIPTEAGDAACIRCAPAEAAERAHIDGSRISRWQLSVYVRCASQADAREWCFAIIDMLDGEIINTGEGLIFTWAESLPQYMGQDGKGATLYLASFSVEVG